MNPPPPTTLSRTQHGGTSPKSYWDLFFFPFCSRAISQETIQSLKQFCSIPLYNRKNQGIFQHWAEHLNSLSSPGWTSTKHAALHPPVTDESSTEYISLLALRKADSTAQEVKSNNGPEDDYGTTSLSFRHPHLPPRPGKATASSQ